MAGARRCLLVACLLAAAGVQLSTAAIAADEAALLTRRPQSLMGGTHIRQLKVLGAAPTAGAPTTYSVPAALLAGPSALAVDLVEYPANWQQFKPGSQLIKCFRGNDGLPSKTVTQAQSTRPPSKGAPGWVNAADPTAVSFTVAEPLPICASDPVRNVQQTYPMRGDICCRAGTTDCRRRAAGVHFFQTDLDITAMPKSCVLKITSSNVAAQVFVSNSEGTSPMIGDGYTGSIDEFSGSIGLLDSLANGSNRISITTIYNKCSADKVAFSAKLECGSSSSLPQSSDTGSRARVVGNSLRATTDAAVGSPTPTANASGGASGGGGGTANIMAQAAVDTAVDIGTGASGMGTTMLCACTCPAPDPTTPTANGGPTAPTAGSTPTASGAPNAAAPTGPLPGPGILGEPGPIPSDTTTPTASGAPSAGAPSAGGSPTVSGATPSAPGGAPPNAGDAPTSPGASNPNLPDPGTLGTPGNVPSSPGGTISGPGATPLTAGDTPTAAGAPTRTLPGPGNLGTPGDVPSSPGNTPSGTPSTPGSAQPTAGDTPTAAGAPTRTLPGPSNLGTPGDVPSSPGDTPSAAPSGPGVVPPTAGDTPTAPGASTPSAGPTAPSPNLPGPGNLGTPGTVEPSTTPTGGDPPSGPDPPPTTAGDTPTAGGAPTTAGTPSTGPTAPSPNLPGPGNMGTPGTVEPSAPPTSGDTPTPRAPTPDIGLPGPNIPTVTPSDPPSGPSADPPPGSDTPTAPGAPTPGTPSTGPTAPSPNLPGPGDMGTPGTDEPSAAPTGGGTPSASPAPGVPTPDIGLPGPNSPTPSTAPSGTPTVAGDTPTPSPTAPTPSAAPSGTPTTGDTPTASPAAPTTPSGPTATPSRGGPTSAPSAPSATPTSVPFPDIGSDFPTAAPSKTPSQAPSSSAPTAGPSVCPANAILKDFETDTLGNLLKLAPINLAGTSLPAVGVPPLDVPGLLGVQFLGFSIANFSSTTNADLSSVVASPTDAIFNLAGVSGLPTIAPVLGVLGLQSYTINSLFIAPLVADSMTVTFTPFTGVASGALNLINGLLGGLLPANLTGAGAAFTVTIIKDNGLGPTPVLFPQPAFSNIAGLTIIASGSGSAPSLLGLSLDQFAIDDVCITTGTAPPTAGGPTPVPAQPDEVPTFDPVPAPPPAAPSAGPVPPTSGDIPTTAPSTPSAGPTAPTFTPSTPSAGPSAPTTAPSTPSAGPTAPTSGGTPTGAPSAPSATPTGMPVPNIGGDTPSRAPSAAPSAAPSPGNSICPGNAIIKNFETDTLGNLLKLAPIDLSAASLPAVGVPPLDVPGLLGVQFLGFSIANFSSTTNADLSSVVASPTDAAFSLAGVSGLPTIAPVLGILGLQSYTINSLFIAPLVADSMTVTFTPFNGVASGALNLLNGLLGGLLPADLTGAGTPFTITITKNNNLGPTPVVFPQPAFSNIAGVTITASGIGPDPGLLGLNLNQFAIDDVCITTGTAPPTAGGTPTAAPSAAPTLPTSGNTPTSPPSTPPASPTAPTSGGPPSSMPSAPSASPTPPTSGDTPSTSPTTPSAGPSTPTSGDPPSSTPTTPSAGPAGPTAPTSAGTPTSNPSAPSSTPSSTPSTTPSASPAGTPVPDIGAPSPPTTGGSCPANALLKNFETDTLGNLLNLAPIDLSAASLPAVGVPPLDVPGLLGVQFLGFSIANFSSTTNADLSSVVSSPTDAIFSLAGVSGLPTIAPVLGLAGLQTYTLNSLFIAPLVADNMTVTFTPFNGLTGALNIVNGLLGGLLPANLTGARAPLTIMITKSNVQGPTLVVFPQPGFSNIAGVTITASGMGPSPGLLGLSVDQFAIDDVCITTGTAAPTAGGISVALEIGTPGPSTPSSTPTATPSAAGGNTPSATPSSTPSASGGGTPSAGTPSTTPAATPSAGSGDAPSGTPSTAPAATPSAGGTPSGSPTSTPSGTGGTTPSASPGSSPTAGGSSGCPVGSKLKDFETDTVGNLLDLKPINLQAASLPVVGVPPLDVSDLLGVQFLGFSIANFSVADTRLSSVVASPTDAIFNLVGASGLPTIAPVLGTLGLQTFTLNSLFIAPLLATNMTVTFTPYAGLASGVLSAVNGLAGGLLPSNLTGERDPYSVTITKSTAGPTRVTFPQPLFSDVGGVIIVASGTGPAPSILGLSLDQYAIDNVCISAGTAAPTAGGISVALDIGTPGPSTPSSTPTATPSAAGGNTPSATPSSTPSASGTTSVTPSTAPAGTPSAGSTPSAGPASPTGGTPTAGGSPSAAGGDPPPAPAGGTPTSGSPPTAATPSGPAAGGSAAPPTAGGTSAATCPAGSIVNNFESDTLGQLVNLNPIDLLGDSIPKLGIPPLNVPNLLGVQFLGFSVANFNVSNRNLSSVLESPQNAAFSLGGISGLPTIAPVLGTLGLQTYRLNSLYIAPLVATDMTVTITPFKGLASGALNVGNNLLGGLLPANLTGTGMPYTFTITKDAAGGPTPVTFPQPAFSNIAGATIQASGRGPTPSLLGLSLDQFAIDDVCFTS